METYLFYDLETSGLSPCFDQVYQFAAIRTDLYFNEISRHEWWVKPTCDVIPAPEAMITHRLSLAELEARGRPEHEVIHDIHALLNTPGTISLGYNTLGFDDEFLRINFFRHLRTPYTHQFAAGCRRMDLFPLLAFYYHFAPDCLEWPQREGGGVSLKLEDLSRANQLAAGPAHQAIVDVEATVALAKRLAQEANIWEYLTGYFVKATESARLSQLPTVELGQRRYPHGVLFDSRLGIKADFQAPVLCLGQHLHYINQTRWLRLDDERLLDLNLPLEEIWAVRKKPAEPPFILPYKERFVRCAGERQAQAEASLAFLQAHPERFHALQAWVLEEKYPLYPETDVEASLYQRGFSSDTETQQMHYFHGLAPKEQGQFFRQFKRTDLQEIALRYLGRFHFEALCSADQHTFHAYLERIWGEGRAAIVDERLTPKLTREAALARIAALTQPLDAEQEAVLAELKSILSKK